MIPQPHHNSKFAGDCQFLDNGKGKTNYLFTLIAAVILLNARVAFAQDYRSVVIADRPASYWPLNETNGPIIHDIVGTNNGICMKGVDGGNGRFTTFYTNDGSAFGMGGPGILHGVQRDKAIYFTNANAAQIVVPYAPELDDTNFTIEAWLNIPHFPIGYTQSVDIVPLSFIYNGHGQAGWVFDLVSDAMPLKDHLTGVLGGWAAKAEGEWTYLNPKHNFQGKWVHAVMTYDGTNLKLYENGNLTAESSGVTYKRVRDSDHSLHGRYPLIMGSYMVYEGSGQGRFYQGGLEQVAIYPNALSANQILNHYKIGAFGSL
jgi:Concanavalin A-like lectin/glucanases superfamily